MVRIPWKNGASGVAATLRVPLWFIGRDNHLMRSIREALTSDRLISFDRTCDTWQSAASGLKSHPDSLPQICLVDQVRNKSGDFGWLSVFRSLAPAMSVILLMGEVCDEDLSRAISGGVAGFLGKPFTIDQVLSAIRAVAGGQVAMSPEILERIGNLAFPRERSKVLGLLTDREKEILTLIVEGYSTQEIADKLFISYFTVDTHLKNIFGKLEVKKRSSLVALLLREHIVF